MIDTSPPAAKAPASPAPDDPLPPAARRERIAHLVLLLVLGLAVAAVCALAGWLFWTLLELTPAAMRFTLGAE